MIQGDELYAGVRNKKSRTHKKLKSAGISNLPNNDPMFTPMMPVAPSYGAGQSCSAAARNQASNDDDLLAGAVISKVNQMLSSSSNGKQLQLNACLI
jgi:hypothetical protein